MELDLDYREYLHDYHKDYSLAPEKIKIEYDMLSPYCSKIKNEYDIKSGGINKLAPNLMSKKNCVLHYRNLKYYLSQGLKLEFKQSAWMKPYIDITTQKRKEATN